MYAQKAWHDDAFIIGNRAALTALRAAIDQALEQPDGRGVTTEVFAADGEGYTVRVRRLLDEPWAGFWERLAMPYTHAIAADRPSDGALHPSALFAEPYTGTKTPS